MCYCVLYYLLLTDASFLNSCLYCNLVFPLLMRRRIIGNLRDLVETDSYFKLLFFLAQLWSAQVSRSRTF